MTVFTLKKHFIIFSALISLCTYVFASSYDLDPRSEAMGSICSTGLGSGITFFPNPAAIKNYNQANRFIIQTEILDSHYENCKTYFLENPSLYVKGQFVGKSVALALGCETYGQYCKEKDDGIRNYKSVRRFDFSLSAAYEFKGLSVGGSVYGGSYLQRADVEVADKSILWDFISNGFFSEHVRVLNGEFVNIRAGIMYTFKRFTFSAKSDEVLTYTGQDTELSFRNAIDTVDFGFYYDSDRFAKRGRLRSWVFSAGIEVKEFFAASRTICAGFEVTHQLAKNYSLSLRSGYISKLNKIGDGVITLGAGGRANKVDISVFGTLPLSAFRNEKSSYKIGIDVTVLM